VKISQIVRAVREILEDSNAITAGQYNYSDKALVAGLNDQLLLMTQRCTEVQQNYHNFDFDLLATNARQVIGTVYEWDLPTWVLKIAEVRENVDQSRGLPYFHLDPLDRHTDVGWTQSSLTTLQLQGWSPTRDLTLSVAKRPALLAVGMLPDQTGMSSTQLRLDTDLDPALAGTTYPHETEANSYANAIIEITGVNGSSHAVGGQIRRAITSTHLQYTSSVAYTVLTVNQAWTVQPVSGDTYEMHAEIPDDHVRLAVLLAARSLAIKKGNWNEMADMRQELGERWASFNRYIELRQTQQPSLVKLGRRGRGPRLAQDNYEGVYWP
jgi:hypothetical protein